MEAETETETESWGTCRPDSQDQRPGKAVDHSVKCSPATYAVDGLRSPVPPEDAVDQSTKALGLLPEDAVVQETRESPPPSETTVDQDTTGSRPASEGAVDATRREALLLSEGTVDQDTTGSRPASEEAIDATRREALLLSEGTVDQDTTGSRPASEEAVGATRREALLLSEGTVDQDTTGSPLFSGAAIDQNMMESPLPSEDTVNQDMVELPPPSEGAVSQDMVELPPPSEGAVSQDMVELPSPSEGAVSQDMVELPPPSEGAVSQGTVEPSLLPSEDAVHPSRPENAVHPEKCYDPRDSCVPSSQSSESVEQDANNNVIESPVLGDGDKAISCPRPEDADDRRLDGKASASPPPGDADDQSEGVGGLLGAQPSEAELIAALRRHSCWVCGTTAASHDANISHMLTHLQTAAGGAPEANALPPLPSLLLPAHAFIMDSTASADFTANPGMDTFNPFPFGDDDCQSFPELRPFDAAPVVQARRPMPALLPLRLMDDSFRGLQLQPGGAAGDDGDLRAPPPLTPPPTWPYESEVPFFKQPPRFSYPGKKVTPRVVRQQPVLVVDLVDENANVGLGLDVVAGMKLRSRVAPGGKQSSSDGRAADSDQDDEDDTVGVEADEDLFQISDSLVCAICLKTFENRDALMEHVKTEVRVMGLQAKRGKKAKAKAPVSGAAKAIDDIAEDEVEGGRHVCKRCPKAFARRVALRLHVSVAHPRVTPSAPKVHVKGTAKAPMALKGDGRQHVCTVCHKRFRRRAHMEQHRLVHSGERPFVCAHCGTSFRRKDRLVVHARTHLSAGRARSGTAFKERVVAEAATAANKAAVEAGAVGGVAIKTAVVPSSSALSGAPPAAGTLPDAAVPTTRAKSKAQSGAVLEAKVSALSAKAAAVAASAAVVSDAGGTRRLSCVTCGASYPLKSRLRRHVLACHAPSMPHVCLTCGKNCITRRLLLGHVEHHNEERVCERGSRVQEHAEDAGAAVQDVAAEHEVADKVLPMDVEMDADADGLHQNPDPVPVQVTQPDVEVPAPAALEYIVQNDGVPVRQKRPLSPDGNDAVVAKKTSAGKLPAKHIVFKVVSKQGSKDAASVAAKFLPKLAADYASSLGQRDGPKPGSKVVYMLLSKRDHKSGAEGGNGSEVAGNGPAAAVKSASKVIFRRVPKNSTTLSGNVLVPKTPPKLGFKVVPRVVAMDSVNLEVNKPTLNTVSGIVSLDPAKSASRSALVSRVSASVVDPGPPAPAAPNALVHTASESKVPSASAPPCASRADVADPGSSQGHRGTPTSAAVHAAPATPQGTPNDSSGGRGSSKGKGTPFENKKSAISNAARTPASALHREPVRCSPRINSARRATPQPLNPLNKAPQPQHPADRLKIKPLNKTPQPDEAGRPGLPSNPLKKIPQPQADGRFLCEKCGRRFMAEKLYLLHVSVHAGARVVKTFECQCCGHKFLDKDVLRAHLRTHL